MTARVVLASLLLLLLPPAGAQAATPVGETWEQHVAVAPDGRAVFTWLRWDGSNWIAQARGRAANGTLSRVQPLSGGGRDAASPRVDIDDQGDAVFTWLRWNGEHNIVQSRARSASGALSVVQNLSSPGQGASEPHVDVDADGDAVFGWVRGIGGDSIAQAKARAADGTLSPVQNLSSGGAFRLAMAVDVDGDAVFVWHRGGVIQARRRAADGTLSSVQDVTGSGAHAPDVGVDDAGDAIVSWSRGEPPALYTRRRAVNGRLSATQLVSAPGSAEYVPGFPSGQLAVTGDGDAVFVWESIDFGGEETAVAIYARRQPAGGTLSPIRPIATAGERPRLAVDAGGDAVFTWVGANADGTLVRARRLAQDGTLSPVNNLAGSEVADPEVAADDAGNALFAWRRDNGGRNFVQGRHRAEGGALSPPFTLSD